VGLDVGRVEEDVREGGVTERSVAERRDDGVELAADPGYLALADPGIDAQRRDQVVDLARAETPWT
jgi:hypothetical protein